MHTRNTLSLALCIAVGSASSVAQAATDPTPQLFHRAPIAGAEAVGHIYLNLATGEMIKNRYPQSPAPRGNTSSGEIWVVDNRVPCAAIDPDLYTIGFVAMVDDPAAIGDPNLGAIAIGATFSDWGDAPPDTKVDAIQGSWWTEHADPDEQGVEGLGATWSFYEKDNGFNGNFQTHIVSFTMFNLTGDPSPGEPGIRGWRFTADLHDLYGDGTTDVSFEIGDTDGDPQGAAFHNPFSFSTDTSGDGFPDGDLDGDGLADFSHRIRYHQPGTMDFNGDGQFDGDPANLARTYIALRAPRGEIDPITGELTVDQSIGGSAGSEDAFEIWYEPFPSFLVSFGTFWYGGFTCDRNGNGVFEGDVNSDGENDYRPFASFGIGLLGPSGVHPPCRVDLNGDGSVDFFDIQAFLAAFNSGDLLADFSPPDGGDGELNFFDIQQFLLEFNAGCP